jgi:hypothetical protein
VAETQLEDIFKAALDGHINIALVAFLLYPSSITLTITASAYTLPQPFEQLSAGQVRVSRASTLTFSNYAYFLPPDDSIHLQRLLIP